MKSVCFFNNKGGVGKTTLLCNVASYIANRFSYRVVVVDADPQCNATQLVLSETHLQRLYQQKRGAQRTRRSLPRSTHTASTTLFDILSPIFAGEPQIIPRVDVMSRTESRFGFDLIPGHPEVSLLEDKLSQAWLGFAGGDLGGARITNWNRQLRDQIERSYDLVFYDVGPSLGALNRSVLIGTDFFVAPMGCDIFSLIGLQNIGDWLELWTADYDDSIRKCKKKWNTTQFPIVNSATEVSRFIGYTVQQYIAKSRKGERRATSAYERILKQIPKQIDVELNRCVAKGLGPTQLKLPDIPHMYSLVPLAQSKNAPIYELTGKDGLVGLQYSQRDQYAEFIEGLSSAILSNLQMRTKR